MRVFVVILASCAVLALPARAAEPEEGAAGDIDKYTPSFPPSVVIEDVYPGDIDTKTFILVEGALLVPDSIRYVDPQLTYTIEIVNEDELDRVEPAAEIRLPETLDLEKVRTEKDPGRAIVRFEQRMWRAGLRLAVRDYGKPQNVSVRYPAFRVTFETTGTLYRATVTLYESDRSLKQHIDSIAGKMGEINKDIEELGASVARADSELKRSLGTVQDNVESVQRDLRNVKSTVETVKTDLGSTKNSVSSMSRDVDSIESKVRSIESDVDSTASKVRSIQSDVSWIKGRLNK